MKTLIISAVLAAATVGCLCLRDLTNPTNQQFSEIELANIEALATTEPNNQCPGMCQEWNDKGGGVSHAIAVATKASALNTARCIK